jgi:hypothetical protein
MRRGGSDHVRRKILRTVRYDESAKKPQRLFTYRVVLVENRGKTLHFTMSSWDRR